MATLSFERPEFLWLLLTLPLLGLTHFFLLRHAKRRALMFANFAALKRATGQRLITRNYTMLFIRMLAILATVLAVAGTTMWYEGVTNENEYVIAIDTSASMSAQDISPTRLDAAKQYALEFTEALDSQTSVGIVSFSGVTFIEQPLTTSRSELEESLDLLEVTAAGTDIPGAIITSTNLLAMTERGRAIILITDGSNTIETFESSSLKRAAQYAKEHRVKIYTIGVGSDVQGPIGYLPQYYNVSASYNQENLLFLANFTDGEHYDAQDAGSLQGAYTSIRAADQTSILSRDLTGGLMALALFLLLLEWGFLSTRFRSLP